MTTWHPRPGDHMALLNTTGNPVGLWRVTDATANKPGEMTLVLVAAQDPKPATTAPKETT